jgi:DNA-binding transcriptional regulator YdaS (Cro superfamily)
MKTQDAIKYAGTAVKLADMLDIGSSGAISQWGEYPPENRQLQIERVTLGALKAEPGCLDRVLGFKQVAI